MPRADTPVVHLIDAHVCRIEINRPHARNAINHEVVDGIDAALTAAIDARVRAIVLTGAGDRAFCAGGDLKPAANSFKLDLAETGTAYARLLIRLMNCEIPTIARVNGACMAGGMGIMAVCDMVVAAEEAIFGLPETKVGLFPMQVASLLQRLMPERLFREMCITGEPITAAEARACGLVNHVVPRDSLDTRIDWLLARTVDKSPTGIRLGKYALRVIADMTFDQSISYTASQVANLAATEDAREGIAAFSERRPPIWSGR